jgi:Tfp pilus assembly protein PilP
MGHMYGKLPYKVTQMKKVILSLILVILCCSLAIANTDTPVGKRRPPGQMPMVYSDTTTPNQFTFKRDPFVQPTEVLPTDCPPSMPLCKFDHSQLKVVGLVQIGAGSMKAFVEDPDGRGYVVVAGQMIGQATVTHISSGGIYLKSHAKGRRDILLPFALVSDKD